ncbi:hypothetical protein SARC_11839 [Sphaeroforma arctica JP610]|uniref:Uncharacterized protein n=1 Tax=Sphaeroforma arctica JP610 TaxID=667725 RepID=A0A0L0FFX1_9EUKA|nr:hypothetical protein SARC_11839 [Sphaeroforma arctica JP610]KNC75640.1 hypothetical protein SARC_11839 [Sphaeroforma arctica JP610]|eukprot:XP_014149542.1 hypothetical protein SARC_11839 [Sphaeroforma arctica JP610]
MCLRRVQNWAQIAVEAEFHRFTKDREVASSESDFIIAFRHRIALPEHTPLWLSAEETRGHPLILSNTPADGDQTHADTNKRPYDAGHPNAEQTPYTNKHRVHAGDEISLAVRALALDGLADYLRR